MKNRRFHFLGRAVIIFQGRILLAHAKGADNTFLPGGHIEVGESIPDGIARELKEEIGVTAQINEYLGAVEHSYIIDSCHHFEINHIFSASLPSAEVTHGISSLEKHLEFMWADPNKLSELNLQPYPLASFLAKPRPKHHHGFWATTYKDII